MQAAAKNPEIITVGIAPCWDVTCRGADLEWGGHLAIREQQVVPAGKALNVSRALAWLGRASVAAGLWGQQDLDSARGALAQCPLITPRFTPAPGATRVNVTLLDEKRQRETHLRAPSRLHGKEVMGQLKKDLLKMAQPGRLMVFAGSLPASLDLSFLLGIFQECQARGVRIVLDSSGPPLRYLTHHGFPWLIKPNPEELADITGRKAPRGLPELVAAVDPILSEVGIILLSRGARGALVVSDAGAWEGKLARRGPRPLSTVGCGDFLLAGFLHAIMSSRSGRVNARLFPRALETAIQTATARAWGWEQSRSWAEAQKEIKVEINRL